LVSGSGFQGQGFRVRVRAGARVRVMHLRRVDEEDGELGAALERVAAVHREEDLGCG
jgi:hypothetical protein